MVTTARLREKVGQFLREGELICLVEGPAALEAEAAWERKAELAAALRDAALAEVPAAPTLVKYTAPSPYLEGTYAALAEAAAALLPAMEPDGARGVELIAPHDAERELVATLLYRVTPR